MNIGDRFREKENGEVYEVVEIEAIEYGTRGRRIRPVTRMPSEDPDATYFSPVGVLENNFEAVP